MSRRRDITPIRKRRFPKGQRIHGDPVRVRRAIKSMRFVVKLTKAQARNPNFFAKLVIWESRDDGSSWQRMCHIDYPGATDNPEPFQIQYGFNFGTEHRKQYRNLLLRPSIRCRDTDEDLECRLVIEDDED